MSDLTNIPEAIADIADEFVQRLRNGESPQVAEYEQRHPDLASAIRDILPALAVIERLKPGNSTDDQGTHDGQLHRYQTLKQIGEYQIVREIGRGGMGVVYEAIQQTLKRRVALKVLPHQVIRDEIRLARFDREARAAARLHHTNIVPVFDFGSGEGVHYFAMQFIHGLPLNQVILEIRRVQEDDPDLLQQPLEWAQDSECEEETRRTQLGDTNRNSDSAKLSDIFKDRPLIHGRGYQENIARLGMDVGRALEYAHQQGVLHRDIKPSNLILDTQGNIWVTDFGLATTDDDEVLTNTGDVLGTIRYMAPEVFNGNADRRSDTYSLGATLYEMLALRPAFEEKDRRRLIRLILNENPPKLRLIDPSVPRDLETIVHKAIEREPGRRYPTAGLLADDLERFLHGKPIRARRASLFAHLSRWISRNPISAVLAAIVLLLLVATAAVSSFAALKLNSIAAERSTALQSSLQNEKRANELAKKEIKAREDAEIQLRRAERIEKFMVRALRSPSLDFDGKQVTIYQVLKRTLNEIDEELSDDPHVQLLALLSINDAFLGLDEIPDALEVIERADRLAERIYDKKNARCLNVKHLKGTTLRQAGRLNEALLLLEDTHQLCLETLGNNDQLTIRVANDLATVLFLLGQEKRSTEIADQIYTVASSTYGPVHKLTLMCLHNKAIRFQNSQRANLAIPILEKAWKLREQHLGKTSLDTLSSRASFGGALRDAGQTKKAVEFLKETLLLCRKHLGDSHSTTLICLNNLAMAQADSGEFVEAIGKLKEVEKGRIEKMGCLHPAVLNVQGNLASLYMHTGKTDSGIEMMQKLRKSTVEMFGADHWRSYKAGSNLALALRKSGKMPEALNTVNAVFIGRFDVKSSDKFETLIAKVNMATILCESGFYTKAAETFQSAIDPAQVKFGEKSSQVRNIRRWYHQSLMANRDWQSVIKNSEGWKRCIDDTVPATERGWRNIDTAYALLQIDAAEQAQPLVEKVMQNYPDVELSGHKKDWALHTQGLLHAKQGKIETAEAALERSTIKLINVKNSIPAKDRFRCTSAIENMIWFYDEIKPDLSKKNNWQKRLEELSM